MKTLAFALGLALLPACSAPSSNDTAAKETKAKDGAPDEEEDKDKKGGTAPSTGAPQGGTSGGGTDGQDQSAPANGDPAKSAGEQDLADEPVMVAGAFLVAIGPTAIVANVGAGKLAFGIALFEKPVATAPTSAAAARVEAFVAVKTFKYVVKEAGAEVEKTAQLVPRSSNATWHAVVLIPEADAAGILRYSLDAAVEEAPVAVPAQAAVSFDPEKAANVAPVFTEVLATAPAPAPVAHQSSYADETALGVHQMFVSDQRYLPGVAAPKGFQSVRDANKLCNQEANADEELATFWWKAVLSDAGADAKQRIVLAGPVESLDGVVLAADAAALLSGGIAAETVTYRNRAIATALKDDFVATGTNADGTVAAGETCGDWLATTGNAKLGDPAAAGKWLDGSSGSCAKARRLYCVSYRKR